MTADATITVAEGYRAMIAFIEAYWERGSRESDDIAVMLSSMDDIGTDATPRPLDIAQWHDWLAAIEKAK